MRIKLNKNILILVTVILLSVSLVAAVYVFMSADKTITNGQSASFTCTIDPMLGSTSYDIRLIGNGINKLLKSGTGSSSVFNVPITVTPANYNNQAGDYIVQCHAKETSCDPCCCDEDTQTANLKVKPAPYCGDGSVGTGETCELPNTNNNNYCSQSASQCSGTKLGTRDAFGNCNNVCGCTFDPFNYKCVKGQCGAACDSNDDCNDGNSHTTDTCLNDCTCKHENIPYCGDGSVGTGETCELPNTNNNNYCGQSTSQCSGTKLGTRDSYGNCDGVCGCTYDSFNYQCVKGQCGATCAVNADCDDQNIHTTDTCLANCTCKHENIPYCGDGSVGAGETCELPNTNDNSYCGQTASQCSGTKLGARDAFGNCNNVCGCTYDPFNYACVKGQCGATCDSNDDCDDGNVHTTDTCLANCTCKHENIPYCGDGSVGSGETCELPNTNNNNYCSQSTSQCSGTKLGTRDSYGNCDSVCGCTYDSFNYQCVKGQCGAACDSNDDCNDGNSHTADTCLANCTCKHENLPYCGDGFVNLTAGEQCELPNTNNNVYCPQDNCAPVGEVSIMNGGGCEDYCEGHKLGTRDAFGNCNSACGCAYDPFNYACVKGHCGAACDSNDDCNDGNAYTTDLCLANCTCQHTTQPYCGDGGVSAGETCELPSTNNNTYCSQSTTGSCSGTKLGIRDAYGNCNSTCGCKYDSFNYVCVKGQCGATCANNADCDDGNSNTADTCLTNCTCKHTTQPYCGDGIIQTGEQCELTGAYAGWGEYGHEYTCNANNTYKHCVNCQYEQVNECKYYCSGDSECDGKAPLTYLESCTTFGFNYLQDFCNENCELEDNNCEDDYNGCTAEPECDEFAPNTGDCNYMCEYKPSPVCGNNIIDSGETCELPNTANNTYCGQTTQECLGTKLGTRDALGNCGNSCGCTYDPFNYACVKDQCGATCDSNDDCDDGNIHTLDTCLANCTCKHNTQDYCGDGIIQAGEQCDLGTSNGVVCTPPYEGSCTYCAANCTNITLTDGYCGDGVVDVPYEECDDGNDVDDDRCSNECEKAPCFNVSLSLDYAHLEIWCGPYPSKNVTAEALFSDNIYARQDSCNGSKEEVAYIYMYWYDVEKVNLSEVKAFLEHKENQALIWLEYYNGTKWKLVCDLSESGSDALNNCQVTLTQGVVDIALRLGVERTVLTGAYEDLDWAYIDLKYCDDPALWMKYDVPTAAATTQTTRHHSSGGGGGGGGSYTTTSTWNCTEWSECDDGKQTRSCKQGIFSKTESQNCTEVILTATTATTSTSAQAAVEEQEDEAEPETGDQTASISFKIGDEDEQETGGNPFLSGENKNDITGLTAGIGKALSSFSINWYAIAIILLIVLCLPVIFHFVTKK